MLVKACGGRRGRRATEERFVAELARVDGQAITLSTMAEAVAALEMELTVGRGSTLFTLNLDHLVKLRRDPAFRQAYSQARHVTADGWPIVWLARRQRLGVRRTAGADMVLPLCDMAARRGLPIFLFGSSEAVLARTAAQLRARDPRLDVRGWSAPRFGFEPHSSEAAAAARRIAESGARLCFVALGAPKQELFAQAAFAQAPHTAFVCIGAGLDFIAGVQRRAPRAMQRLHLEWAWRLACEPRRLAGRYVDCALLFASLLVRGSAATRRFAER